MRATMVAVLYMLLSLGALGADQPSPDAVPDAPSAAPHLLPVSAATPAIISSTLITPAPAPKRKTVDSKFVLLGALAAGLTVADVELTQHCLNQRTCVEMNPFLPRSRPAMYAAMGSFNAAVFYWSYRRKAAGKKLWWVAPLAVIGANAIGTIDNSRFAR